VQDPRRYLSILGNVFDVTGAKHYEPGGGYEFFVAKDSSAAFTTGVFEGDADDNLSALSDDQINAVFDWFRFYEKHETYRFVGLLEGRFFDKDRKITAETETLVLAVQRVAEKRTKMRCVRKRSVQARAANCHCRLRCLVQRDFLTFRIGDVLI